MPGTGLPKSRPLKRPQHCFALAAHALGRQQTIEPQNTGSLELVALFGGEREGLGHGSVSSDSLAAICDRYLTQRTALKAVAAAPAFRIQRN
jgi:hypothetical protein